MSSRREDAKDIKVTKAKKRSIWEEVLADVSKGTLAPDSHLIVLGSYYAKHVGSKNSGKRTLLSSLNQRLGKAETTKSKTLWRL